MRSPVVAAAGFRQTCTTSARCLTVRMESFRAEVWRGTIGANLYGTAHQGGAYNGGVVFEATP